MDKTEIIERGGRRWRVSPQAAAALLAGEWPLDRPDALTVIKRGNRRTVARIETPGDVFYVKTNETGGLLRRVAACLGLGSGRREWDALLAARAAGLDVPEPAALSTGGGREILVTRQIAGAQRLDEYLFERYFEPLHGDPPYPGARPPELISIFRHRRTPPEGTISPRQLAEALARIVSRLARADLYLPDLHPGNILISGSPGAWRLSLVDLAETEHPAPAEAMLEHLARLEHFFEPIASVAERMRCLARLAGQVGGTPTARQVTEALAAYRRRFYRRRDHRTRRQSKYFRRLAIGEWRGWATDDWAYDAARLVESYGSGSFPGAETVKDSRTSTVWRVALEGGRTLFIKRHNRAARRGLARGTLEPSRSIAALRRGHALLARGIATARPAAAVDRRCSGKVCDTLLVTEAVAGVSLVDWLKSGPSPASRRRLTWRLARLVQRLHEAGYSHRDLKAHNFLVAQGDGLDPRPVLVDLDGISGGRRPSARRRARDLMRLAVSLMEIEQDSRSEQLRFLRTYLGRPGCPGGIMTLGRRRGSKRGARRLRRWWQRLDRLGRRKVDSLKRKGAWLPDKPKADQPPTNVGG
jgi:hypothetical protein